MVEKKKNPRLDHNRKKFMFFNIGLILSLTLVISAFEWKFIGPMSVVSLVSTAQTGETFIPPITVIPPNRPKPIQPITIIETTEEEKPKPEITLDQIDLQNEPIEVVVNTTPPVEEEVIDVFPTFAVQRQPSFNGGGEEAFLKYIGQKLKYPRQARQLNVEGKVFVEFVIDKDGSMTAIRVMRGIGYGCDEEVLRVLNNAPKWEPGKQRGVPVKVRMVLPVTFKLH